MNSHKNARLTPLGRTHMIEQMTRIGLEAAARQAGLSSRRAIEWRSRFNQAGTEGLHDRFSRPHASPRATAQDKHERILAMRGNYRLSYAQIAHRTGVSMATVGRICCLRALPSCLLSRRCRPYVEPRANCCTWIPRNWRASIAPDIESRGMSVNSAANPAITRCMSPLTTIPAWASV